MPSFLWCLPKYLPVIWFWAALVHVSGPGHSYLDLERFKDLPVRHTRMRGMFFPGKEAGQPQLVSS